MDNDKTQIEKDVEYLEKAFKKFTPHMLSSPYIPTPSVMVKSGEDRDLPLSFDKRLKNAPATKPSAAESKARFEDIIYCLHEGAQAYSVGDYGTAINCFTRLLGNDWLKHATYFYLVKTLIKLDIEKELLLLRSKLSANNARLKK